MRTRLLRALAIGISLLALDSTAHAQDTKTPTDDEIIAKLSTVAPTRVVREATIVVMEQDGKPRVVREGTGQFTCIQPRNAPMCLDRNAMEWMHAWQSHQTPPQKIGFIYMLDGDNGASNTDPYAGKGPQPDNHWVKTGPHVMIVGPVSSMMEGYPRAPDGDPTKPYAMWPGTPYEHLMIPVK